MGFEVYDLDGNNVTDEHDWVVDKKGTLFYFADGQLHDVDEYWYSMI